MTETRTVIRNGRKSAGTRCQRALSEQRPVSRCSPVHPARRCHSHSPLCYVPRYPRPSSTDAVVAGTGESSDVLGGQVSPHPGRSQEHSARGDVTGTSAESMGDAAGHCQRNASRSVGRPCDRAGHPPRPKRLKRRTRLRRAHLVGLRFSIGSQGTVACPYDSVIRRSSVATRAPSNGRLKGPGT